MKLAVFVFLLSLTYIRGQSCPNGMFNVTVNKKVVDASYALFPESQSPNNVLIDNVTLSFTQKSNVTITFLREGASYRNVFGYFVYNTSGIIQYKTVFPDVTWKSEGGCLDTGDSVKFGPFEVGTKIGFWVKPNGYNYPNTDKIWHSITNDNIKNVDGKNHVVWVKVPIDNDSTNDIIIIGFEDQSLGDKDYNDVMFYATVEGSYSEDIPTYENGTLNVCVNGTIGQYKEVATTNSCNRLAVMEDTSLCSGYVSIPAGWRIAKNEDIVGVDVYALFPNEQCLVINNGGSLTGINCQPSIKIIKNCYNTGCETGTKIIITTEEKLPSEKCVINSGQFCVPVNTTTIQRVVPSEYLPLNIYPLEVTVKPSSNPINLNIKLKNTDYVLLDLVVVVDTSIEPLGRGGNNFKTEMTRLVNRLSLNDKIGTTRVGLVTLSDIAVIRPLSPIYDNVIIPVYGSGLQSSKLTTLIDRANIWDDNLVNLRIMVVLSNGVNTNTQINNTLLITNSKYVRSNVDTKYITTTDIFSDWSNDVVTNINTFLNNRYISYTTSITGPNILPSQTQEFNVTYYPSSKTETVNVYGNGQMNVVSVSNNPPKFILNSQQRHVIVSEPQNYTIDLSPIIMDIDSDLLNMSVYDTNISSIVSVNGYKYTLSISPELVNTNGYIKLILFDGCDYSNTHTEYIIFTQTTNRPPISVGDTITTPEDTPVNFNLVSYDPDTIFGDTTSITIVHLEGQGIFNLTVGQIIYSPTVIGLFTPFKDVSSDTQPLGIVKFLSTDKSGFNSDVAVVNIYVLPVDDPPRYEGDNILIMIFSHISLI